MARMTLGVLVPDGMAVEEARQRIQDIADACCDEQGIPRGRVTVSGQGVPVEVPGLPEEAANRLKAGHPVLAAPPTIVEE